MQEIAKKKQNTREIKDVSVKPPNAGPVSATYDELSYTLTGAMYQQLSRVSEPRHGSSRKSTLQFICLGLHGVYLLQPVGCSSAQKQTLLSSPIGVDGCLAYT